jgi:transposase
MTQPIPPTIERHLAVDLHKHYLVIGGVNARQEVVLPPRRIPLDEWLTWAKVHLKPSDVLVVEATTNTWWFYDQTYQHVGQLLVADPRKIAWVAQTRVKTDAHDVMKLARLSAAGLIPLVWVPPLPVRELRSLLAHRRRLVKTQTMLKNRLHSLLHRFQILPPAGELFAAKQRAWWESLSVSPTERLHVKHDLATLDQVATQISEIDDELRRLSCSEPWADVTPYLMHLPGVGLIVAMTVLAAIGDITRFPTSKKLVGYSGLAAGVHDSGQTHRSGHITKEGRKELRYVLVEAAWHAVDSNDFWKAQFERLCRRMEKNKAIVAIARQLLVVIWHVLTERAVDQHADPDMVAFKLMTWSWKLTNEQRGGLTTRQFVRYQLLRLGLGHALTHVMRGGGKYLIAPPDEVLKLKPELQATI